MNHLAGFRTQGFVVLLATARAVAKKKTYTKCHQAKINIPNHARTYQCELLTKGKITAR